MIKLQNHVPSVMDNLDEGNVMRFAFDMSCGVFFILQQWLLPPRILATQNHFTTIPSVVEARDNCICAPMLNWYTLENLFYSWWRIFAFTYDEIFGSSEKPSIVHSTVTTKIIRRRYQLCWREILSMLKCFQLTGSKMMYLINFG